MKTIISVVLSLIALVAAVGTINKHHVVPIATSSPYPSQFDIVQNGVVGGTGYFAWTESGLKTITVLHIAKYLSDYSCTKTSFGYEDGSCLLFGWNSEANIIRDVSTTPKEVSLWNPDLGFWMPFKVIQKTPDGFIAKGLITDTNGNSEPDFLSRACFTMSGSPAVESHLGIPKIKDGYLISKGELSATQNADDELCSSTIIVINPKLPN